MIFWDQCGGNTWPVVKLKSEICEVSTFLLGETQNFIPNHQETILTDIRLTCPNQSVNDWTFVIENIDNNCEHTFEYNIDGFLENYSKSNSLN